MHHDKSIFSDYHPLKKVLHVSKLKNGLMSLNTLALEGWTSTIMKNSCIVNHGEFKIHSPIRNGLCVWNQNKGVSETTEFISLLAKSSKDYVSLTD